MTNPASSRIRIAVADDNPGLLVEMLVLLDEEFDIVAAVPDGLALLEVCDRLKPDVVVTDISMPQLNGFGVAEQLLVRGNPPLVFWTIHEEGAFVAEAKALGALGYVLKRSAPATLRAAIRSAYRRTFFLSPEFQS